MSTGIADYRARARQHQPADLRDAIRTLASQGLKAADIARLLELSEAAISALLQSRPIASNRASLPFDESAAAHAATWRRSPVSHHAGSAGISEIER